jgi:hypothetical protein
VEEHGRKWKEIGFMMDRSRFNVRDKYRQMGTHNYSIRDKHWDLAHVATLFKNVQQNISSNFFQINASFLQSTFINKDIIDQQNCNPTNLNSHNHSSVSSEKNKIEVKLEMVLIRNQAKKE